MSVPRRLPRAGDKPGKPTGRYQARIPYVRNGKTVQLSVGTFASKRDAIDCQNLELAKLRAGGFIDPADRKVTVEAWSREWYALRRTPDRRTKGFLRNHIVPRFGAYRLEDVEKIEVQRWVNDLADRFAPDTVRIIHSILQRLLDSAVEYDRLPRNRCAGIALPKLRPTHVVPLTVPQMAMLADNIAPRFAAMVHLSSWSGLRWGELAALRWSDVDLEAGRVTVNQARKEDGTVGLPKNDKARSVRIAPATVEVLRRHRRDYGGHELLFTSARGQHSLSYNNYRQGPWAKAVRACGFEVAPTFHDLRHGYAGHMVMQGMDWKVLSANMGHATPAFTMNRYGWIRPDHDEVTVAAIEAAMALGAGQALSEAKPLLT